MANWRFGYWLCIIGIVLGIAYLLAMIGVLLVGSFPPGEPYQTVISTVTLLLVPVLVLLWVAIIDASSKEKRLFAGGSLALIIIFGTLTSINRYVSLTVVPQATRLGITEGLSWFQPYGWPSIMLAIELLAWGLYLGLAFLCLAPAFTNGKIEKAIFWTLIMSGILCLLADLGQVLNVGWLNFLGVLAWGPGLTLLLALLAAWFKREGSRAAAT